MLKGKKLLEYTATVAHNDYLEGLKLLATDILGFSLDALRLCNLVNPIALSEHIGKLLLEVPNLDECLVDYLERKNIPLPERWGWRHTCPWREEPEVHEWYKEKHLCYDAMYRRIHESIDDAWDSTSEPIIVQANDDNTVMTVTVGDHVETFELYEM